MDGGHDLAVAGHELPAVQARVQVRAEFALQLGDEIDRLGIRDRPADLVETQAEAGSEVVAEGSPVSSDSSVEPCNSPRLAPIRLPISSA